MKRFFVILLIGAVTLASCKKDKDEPKKETGPYLIMTFDMDSTMARYDNFGNPVSVPPGNAAQSPKMHLIAAHYVEFTPNEYTMLGDGDVVYNSPKTSSIPGQGAIIFDDLKQVKNGGTFLKIPLKDVKAGSYNYLRISIAYENYDITYHYDTTYTINGVDYPVVGDAVGTLANFIGFNNYITKYTIKNNTVSVNGDKSQGYWGFESSIEAYGNNYPILTTGDVPAGSTTVPNVLGNTSPIPAGSCIITGDFANGPFTITGDETKDVKINVKVSTNDGFEWKDKNGNGKYDPLKGEHPVDMGVRGIRGVIE